MNGGYSQGEGPACTYPLRGRLRSNKGSPRATLDGSFCQFSFFIRNVGGFTLR